MDSGVQPGKTGAQGQYKFYGEMTLPSFNSLTIPYQLLFMTFLLKR